MTVYDSLVIIDPLILTNQDNNYILQHQDVYDLQKYLWSGVLLPITEEDYQGRLNISDRTASKLSDVIKPLVDVYKIAQSQCQSFYQDTFRGKLPKLTDDALTYAQKAADGSYAPIFQDIIDIDSAATAEELKRLQDDLTTRISDHYDTVTTFQTKASSCADDLRKFEQQTREYQSSLKQCEVLVHDRTVRELGGINELQNKVKKCREEIKTDTEEYEHDKLVACTTPSYAWLGFVGLIAASTIAGVYGKKAADMAARLDELNDELDRYEGDLKDESSIIADLTAIDGDLEGLLDIIGPAIVVVEKMGGVWQSFAGDFYSMLSEITQDVGTANPIIARLVEKTMETKWSDVAGAIKKYQQAMDVSLPISAYGANVSIDEISRQLHAQANKWGASEANT
ncbi:hypothetical protein EV715DRAFT_190513 [Schizophyllum commune]